MDNSCQHTKDDIWNYHSGLLTRREETQMQEHILLCQQCQAKLNQLRQLDKILSPSEPLVDSLVGKIQDDEEVKKKAKPIYFYIAIAAIAAVIALILFFAASTKIIRYPFDMDNSDVFAPGDSTKVDSSFIKSIEIDTLSHEEIGKQ